MSSIVSKLNSINFIREVYGEEFTEYVINEDLEGFKKALAKSQNDDI